jgi:opacity protein-like surface antigen
MTRKHHKISRKIALAVALVALATTAAFAANSGWQTPVSYSANGHSWQGRVQPSNAQYHVLQPSNGQFHMPVRPGNGHSWN